MAKDTVTETAPTEGKKARKARTAQGPRKVFILAYYVDENGNKVRLDSNRFQVQLVTSDASVVVERIANDPELTYVKGDLAPKAVKAAVAV
jgi:hypothetical protein